MSWTNEQTATAKSSGWKPQIKVTCPNCKQTVWIRPDGTPARCELCNKKL